MLGDGELGITWAMRSASITGQAGSRCLQTGRPAREQAAESELPSHMGLKLLWALPQLGQGP